MKSIFYAKHVMIMALYNKHDIRVMKGADMKDLEETVTITIEETISKDFEVPKEVLDEIDILYKRGELVLEDANLISAQYMVHSTSNDLETSWIQII